MKVTYYAACSLDGFIAECDGSVDWLNPFLESGDDHGFADFFGSIDAIVMGSATYEFALQHPPWLAPDRPSWVFTKRDLVVADPSVTLTRNSPSQVISEMAAKGVKSVWLMGGGKLASSFKEAGLTTHYEIALVPTLLGSGIPLLAPTDCKNELRLVGTKNYPTGIVTTSYDVVS